MRHPEHDRLREEVRSWYRGSSPQMGYHVEHRRFGFYRRHAGHPDSNLVVVETLASGEVPEFLADASDYFDNHKVQVWIDDKDLDLRLGPALVAAGLSIDKANTYLAHVGPVPERLQLSNVTVEPVTARTLIDYVLVKLKGFAGSEDRPSREHIDEEMVVRKSEFESIGRFLIARVGDEPAAIVGYYDATDRMIFNLATRKPFRMSGIARQLLCNAVAESYDRGYRSVMINTDPADTPIQWYNRLGFTDEVYYRSSYIFDPTSALTRR
jgi:ribosomal protein S18 acetylase RimI-like enzyme